MNALKQLVKAIIKPIRTVLTHLIVGAVAVLNRHIAKQVWHQTNAFRWAAAYIVKIKYTGIMLNLGFTKAQASSKCLPK